MISELHGRTLPAPATSIDARPAGKLLPGACGAGLTKTQEMTLVRGIASQCQVQPLHISEMEVEQFQYNFTSLEKSHVQVGGVARSAPAPSCHPCHCTL